MLCGVANTVGSAPDPVHLVVMRACGVDLVLALFQSDGRVAVINGLNHWHDGDVLAITLNSLILRLTGKQRRSGVYDRDGLNLSVAVGRVVLDVPSADQPVQLL